MFQRVDHIIKKDSIIIQHLSDQITSHMCLFFSRFMPPDDPLGRHGPSLDNFLRKKPLPTEHKRQLCPYGMTATVLRRESLLFTTHCLSMLCIAKPFIVFHEEGMWFQHRMTSNFSLCVSLYVFLRQKVHVRH